MRGWERLVKTPSLQELGGGSLEMPPHPQPFSPPSLRSSSLPDLEDSPCS